MTLLLYKECGLYIGLLEEVQSLTSDQDAQVEELHFTEEVQSFTSDQVSQVEELHFTEEVQSFTSDQDAQIEELHFTEEVQSLTSDQVTQIEELHFTEEVQSLTSDQDEQVEEKHVENYLDTALEDPLVWPDSHDTACPRNDITSDNYCGYEGNGINSMCVIYPNHNPSKPVSIKTSKHPTKFSEEFTDDVSSDPKVCNAESDLSMANTNLDYQYSSDCANSIQTVESEGFSLFSNKYNSINKQTESIRITLSNNESVHSQISGKLVESTHFESHSVYSEISNKSVYSSRSGSVLLDGDGESIMSTQSLFKSCGSSSLEDTFYLAQSELPDVFVQNQSKSIHVILPESMPSSCFCTKEYIDAVNSCCCCKSQFSSQSETSSSGMLEQGPKSVKLISSPIECTEVSELAVTEGQSKSSFSTLMESWQSDSLRKYHSSPDSEESVLYDLGEFTHSTHPDASLYKRSEEAVSFMPKILVQSEKEMEFISFSHCLSPCDQRQSEMQPVSSHQVSNKSDKSHDIAFFKIINLHLLLKAKVTCDENVSNIGDETGRFNMATTELSVDKKHLIRPEVFYKGMQRNFNAQKKTHYWHQVMQLYFTFMAALSFGRSLKWLFQLRPVMLHALHRSQSILIYPFTTLNEFFKCESRDSPPSAEECMSLEWMRLQTFQNYPSSAKGSPSRIAREGFFYTGQGTQTRCFSCGLSHGEWNYFDNPREVHQRLSPNCPFLNGRQEGHRNIAMSPGGSGDVDRADCNLRLPPSGSDVSQSQTVGSRSESRELSRASHIDEQQQKSVSRETTPRVQSHTVEESAQYEAHNRPKFPEHVSLPSRIASFSNGWPPYLDQTPQQMAEAGFFFTGNQDYTRCYQCGGGLRNWEPGDNPWIEHCRWYPTCPHVEKGKGQRFVNAVLKKQAELLSTQRAESRRRAQYGISSTDPLETLAAISLLEMGYPRDTVRNSILILRRQREPAAEITAMEVLEFIWKEEDIERQRQEEEASRPHHPGDAQPPALPTLMQRLNLGVSPAVTQAAVQQSASTTTSASSLNSSAAMMMTSVTMATSSTSGTSSITSVSTPASGSTQITNGSGQTQRQDEGQGHNTSARGNGNRSDISRPRDGVSEGSVSKKIAAQKDGSKKGEPRPSGAEGGQSEGPGAHAQAVAAIIDEDEEFHSLDSEEMENKDYGELEEENKRLKEQTTCKICMENPVRVIFLPCGHLVCCELCAPAFRKCPICRKRIQQSVKTLL